MRLLNVHTLEFDDFPSKTAPPYVIASHRWEKDETTFQEVAVRENEGKAGYQKVLGFADYVRRQISNVHWIWIDTCCIDKRNNAELSEAINSMFHWYHNSAVCLAYLADVPLPKDEKAFNGSVWFRRGWTLQELLAPRTVVFLSCDWQVIGHKGNRECKECGNCLYTGKSLNEAIAAITGIPGTVLHDYEASQALSTEERLKWMEGRVTTREEDRWYCLLGMFDVSMTIRYGALEADKTESRFLAKIKKKDPRLRSTDASSARNFQDRSPFNNTQLSAGINLEGNDIVTNDRILEDLYYSALANRLENIVTPSDDTYEWIFQSGHQQPANFRRWLETSYREDLYWISGKAGSGKSTLIKFIASHPLVKDSLDRWAGSDRLLTAQHYFWYAGTTIQNSEEGLLRSLLYQVCKADRSILEVLFPAKTYLEEVTTNVCSLRSRVQQLSQIGQTGSKKFCFFLDGLDEYRPDVEHTQLAKFVLALVCLPNIKIVVSSRPWTAFEKTLTCRVKTGLYLHEFTRDDLRQLARNRLSSAASSLTEDQIVNLAERIQERSQGVFLWAHLVTGSLQQRAMSELGFDELVECLDEYPTDLHAFLRDNIFQRIHGTFRQKETVKCLKLATMMHLEDYKLRTKYGGPTTCWLNYWLVNRTNYADNNTNLLKQPMQHLTSSKMEHNRIAFSKILDASCRDLLHLSRGEVIFAHRSVFDFLMSTEMKTELDKQVPAHFLDGNLIARIYVARCKMATSISFSYTRANIESSRKHHANCLSATASSVASYADLYSTEYLDDFLRSAEEIFFQSDELICKSACKHFLEIGDEHDQCLLFLLDYLCYRRLNRYPERVAKRFVEQFDEEGLESFTSERCRALCYQSSKSYVGSHWLRTNDFFLQMHGVLSERHAEVKRRLMALASQDDTRTLANENSVQGRSLLGKMEAGSIGRNPPPNETERPQKLSTCLKPSVEQALPRRQSNEWDFPLDVNIELDYEFDDEGLMRWIDA